MNGCNFTKKRGDPIVDRELIGGESRHADTPGRGLHAVRCLDNIIWLASFFGKFLTFPDGPCPVFIDEHVAFWHGLFVVGKKMFEWEESPDVWGKESNVAFMILCTHCRKTLDGSM